MRGRKCGRAEDGGPIVLHSGHNKGRRICVGAVLNSIVSEAPQKKIIGALIWWKVGHAV